MSRSRHPGATLATAVEDLLGSIRRLVEGVARTAADGKPRQLQSRSKTAPTSSTSAKIRRAVAASWAQYTPAQRAERVRKMLAGRGLKPKAAAKRSAASRRTKPPAAPPRKARASRQAHVNPWAKLTPGERAARIAKMQAGRRAASQSPASASASA